MSSQELKFYKCKLCTAQLLAGEYCIDCAKKDKVDKALNTKQKNPGYPFISPCVTPDYGQFRFGTATDTTDAGSLTVGTTTIDQPIWTNFASSGNATNIQQDIASGAVVAVSGSTAMDFNINPPPGYRQNIIPSKGKRARH